MPHLYCMSGPIGRAKHEQMLVTEGGEVRIGSKVYEVASDTFLITQLGRR